jgi:hypothetical protein
MARQTREGRNELGLIARHGDDRLAQPVEHR